MAKYTIEKFGELLYKWFVASDAEPHGDASDNYRNSMEYVGRHLMRDDARFQADLTYQELSYDDIDELVAQIPDPERTEVDEGVAAILINTYCIQECDVDAGYRLLRVGWETAETEFPFADSVFNRWLRGGKQPDTQVHDVLNNLIEGYADIYASELSELIADHVSKETANA